MLDSSLRFAPPPRPVPFSLSILTTLNGFAQVGFFVLAFSSIFFWVFAANADFSFLTFKAAHGRATGTVTRVVDTSARQNRSTIHANHYQYSVAGKTLEGMSYSNGDNVQAGDRVLVEYFEDKPLVSRIAGQRRKMFGAGAAFVVIFPLIGLGFIWGGVRRGTRRARLLRDGICTTGVLKATRPTNTRVNNRRVYELDFEFTARDGRRCTAKARTSITDRLTDEREEPLLYDPENPDDAVMLDEAPSRPRFNESGMLVGRPVAALLAMILPALVIAVNTLVLLVKLG